MMHYIKEYRMELGYSQSEVASYLSISRPTYSQLENGVRKLRRREIVALCELFIIKEEDLYIKPKPSKIKFGKIVKKRQEFIKIGKELIKLGYRDIGDDIYDIEYS